ncbi:hypothetical protein, partial [Novosphingobium sp. AP12]|uniref:hypothetical protein n=1 Tax=Novosphingobium sp. AP12 TaxID=1144305 RepID=UPI000271FB32
MAKTPTRSPAGASDNLAPPKTLADIAGESPIKADPIPKDAEISLAFAEPQGSGGETHQTAGGDVETLT